MRFPAIVGPRATVVHDRQSFPMPPESIGLVGALHLFPDWMTIIAGAHQATYPRDPPFKELAVLFD
jgi:hypothetical protein